MMKTQTGFLASWMDINQAEMRTNQAKAYVNLKEIKEEITVRLEAMIQNNKERMQANHKKMDAMMDANQEKITSRTQANNEKFEVIRRILIS
jgi:predicted nuclease with TOPRIM domain